MRILVIEDESKVAEALKRGLEAEFYEVTLAHSGEEGFFQLSSETFDLVILDLMLPGRDGIEVLTTLRRRGIETPVLILTARDTVEDRVRGLDSGADDISASRSAPRREVKRPLPSATTAPASRPSIEKRSSSGFTGWTRGDPGRWAEQVWVFPSPSGP